jgi:hypothetical protein
MAFELGTRPMDIDRALTRQRSKRLPSPDFDFARKLFSQRTRDDEETFDLMRANCESVWKEIDESNLQRKNILNKEVEDDKKL